MRHLVEQAGLGGRVTLDSAGTGHWHAGELADPRTRTAAANRGIAIRTARGSSRRPISGASISCSRWIATTSRRSGAWPAAATPR